VSRSRRHGHPRRQACHRLEHPLGSRARGAVRPGVRHAGRTLVACDRRRDHEGRQRRRQRVERPAAPLITPRLGFQSGRSSF